MKVMNVEKSHKSVHVCPIFFFQARENLLKFDTTAGYSYLSVKRLSLRGNTLRLYRAKHFPLMNWTYGDTGFYIG